MLSQLLLLLFFGEVMAPAEQAIDLYLPIFDLIQQADTLGATGDEAKAVTKYREAQKALLEFRRGYTEWNGEVVSYRLKYVTARITDLTDPNRAALAQQTTTSTRETGTRTTASAASRSPARLIDAGAQPRKVLRLHPKAGDHQALDMALSMTMEISMGEMQNQPMKLPAMKVGMEATVKSVSNEGDIAYDILMREASVSSEAGVAPQIAEAMKSAFDGLKGLSGTGTMSNRGVNKGTEIKAPPDAEPQLRQVIEQMNDSFARLAAPLPEEAVGPGARWEVKMPLKSQGMTIDQTAVYNLVSIDGDRFVTRSTIAQRASNQKIQNPAVPGIKVDLTRMAGKGEGNVTFDLARLLPHEGTFGYESEMAMGMNVNGQNQAMTMKTDLNLRFEEK